MIGRQVSHFYVIRSLGQGGMGMVFEAQDTRLPRSVAIKFLKPALALHADAVRRFRREARLASSLNHPNICTILDIDEADGQVFIAMEMLQGESLKQRLTGAIMGLNEIIDVGLQVARALTAAHAQGIVHRDITPGNIFLTSSGLVKLLDFGLAKQFATQENEGSTTDGLTAEGGIVGTVHYMAPELFASGAPLDTRCDLYALGAVLYQMACGARPFEAPSKLEVIALIRERPHIPLRRLAPQHPVGLERIVDRLLSKQPDDRYATATHLQTELEALRHQHVATPSVPAGAPPRAIAVLPFRALTNDPAFAAIGEGIADDISARLTLVPALRVAPRTSTRRVMHASIREIGHRLDVPWIVEGSVQHAPNELRVTAGLLSAADERPIGAAITVTREGPPLLQMQSDLAAEMAVRIAAALPSGGTRLTANPEALNAFKRGQHHWQSRFNGEWRLALEQFQLAVERDRRFALAYVALAGSYEFLGSFALMKPAIAFRIAREFVDRAIELDESLALAHAELGLVRMGGDWDWDGAEQAFRRAIELDPAHPLIRVCYALLLSILGRDEAAAAEIAVAAHQSPQSRTVLCGDAQLKYFARDYDAAITSCNRCFAIDPHYIPAMSIRGQCYHLLSRVPEALSDLEQTAVRSNRMPYHLGVLGYCYGKAGLKDRAADVLEEIRRQSRETYVPPQCYVFLHAGLGDHRAAMAHQEAAYNDGASPFNYLAPYIRDLYTLDPLHKSRLEQMRLAL